MAIRDGRSPTPSFDPAKVAGLWHNYLTLQKAVTGGARDQVYWSGS
jgi:hypothetical protein